MDDRGYYWDQGYTDGLEARPWQLPNEARNAWHRNDYATGYDAGAEDRAHEPAEDEPDAWGDGSLWAGLRGFTGGAR